MLILVLILYGIMTDELVIREIEINEAAGQARPRQFRFTCDEFRGHYAT